MGDIEAGLEALVDTLREKHIRSVAIPPLGSGLGLQGPRQFGIDDCIIGFLDLDDDSA